MDNDPFPVETRWPDPQKVTDYLWARGWFVEVLTHPERGLVHLEQHLPDEVWLQALRAGGMTPLPCVQCYQSGDGHECMRGRCAGRPSLILPGSATWGPMPK